jgi:hypothetical protein
MERHPPNIATAAHAATIISFFIVVFLSCFSVLLL